MTADLATAQDLFQDRLLDGSDGIRDHLTAGGPHLDVYAHAYLARLREVMGEDFPALHTLLGDDHIRPHLTEIPFGRAVRFDRRQIDLHLDSKAGGGEGLADKDTAIENL